MSDQEVTSLTHVIAQDINFFMDGKHLKMWGEGCPLVKNKPFLLMGAKKHAYETQQRLVQIAATYRIPELTDGDLDAHRLQTLRAFEAAIDYDAIVAQTLSTQDATSAFPMPDEATALFERALQDGVLESLIGSDVSDEKRELAMGQLAVPGESVRLSQKDMAAYLLMQRDIATSLPRLAFNVRRVLALHDGFSQWVGKRPASAKGVNLPKLKLARFTRAAQSLMTPDEAETLRRTFQRYVNTRGSYASELSEVVSAEAGWAHSDRINAAYFQAEHKDWGKLLIAQHLLLIAQTQALLPRITPLVELAIAFGLASRNWVEKDMFLKPELMALGVKSKKQRKIEDAEEQQRYEREKAAAKNSYTGLPSVFGTGGVVPDEPEFVDTNPDGSYGFGNYSISYVEQAWKEEQGDYWSGTSSPNY